MRQGEQILYYENGNIYLKANYIDNNIHGEYIEYNKDGTIRAEDYYINGIRQRRRSLEDLKDLNPTLYDVYKSNDKELLKELMEIEHIKLVFGNQYVMLTPYTNGWV